MFWGLGTFNPQPCVPGSGPPRYTGPIYLNVPPEGIPELFFVTIGGDRRVAPLSRMVYPEHPLLDQNAIWTFFFDEVDLVYCFPRLATGELSFKFYSFNSPILFPYFSNRCTSPFPRTPLFNPVRRYRSRP